MPFVVLAQALAFQETDPANPTIPIADEEIVERGGAVPDYVSTFTVSALANSGLVAYVNAPDPAIFPANQLPAQVRTADQPPVLPSDPNGVPFRIGDLAAPAPEPVGGDVAPAPEPVTDDAPFPLASDKKEVWESYAQRPEIGMTQAEAETMTKAALMAEVNGRYDAANK